MFSYQTTIRCHFVFFQYGPGSSRVNRQIDMLRSHVESRASAVEAKRAALSLHETQIRFCWTSGSGGMSSNSDNVFSRFATGARGIRLYSPLKTGHPTRQFLAARVAWYSSSSLVCLALVAGMLSGQLRIVVRAILSLSPTTARTFAGSSFCSRSTGM